jgi:hypothetical protein
MRTMIMRRCDGLRLEVDEDSMCAYTVMVDPYGYCRMETRLQEDWD